MMNKPATSFRLETFLANLAKNGIHFTTQSATDDKIGVTKIVTEVSILQDDVLLLLIYLFCSLF